MTHIRLFKQGLSKIVLRIHIGYSNVYDDRRKFIQKVEKKSNLFSSQSIENSENCRNYKRYQEFSGSDGANINEFSHHHKLMAADRGKIVTLDG